MCHPGRSAARPGVGSGQEERRSACPGSPLASGMTKGGEARFVGFAPWLRRWEGRRSAGLRVRGPWFVVLRLAAPRRPSGRPEGTLRHGRFPGAPARRLSLETTQLFWPRTVGTAPTRQRPGTSRYSAPPLSAHPHPHTKQVAGLAPSRVWRRKEYVVPGSDGDLDGEIFCLSPHFRRHARACPGHP